MPDDIRPDEPDQGSGTTVAEQPEADAAAGEGAKPDKLLQTVEVNEIGPCKVHIKVAIDRESIDKRLNAKYKEIIVDSNVAGFRPGKAPRKLVARRYQKEVSDRLKAELLLESLEQLSEEQDVAPLAAPDLDPFKIELPATGPLLYEFDVEVRPKFDVPNYKGLKIKRPVREISDEDVTREERRLLTPYGERVPKPEGDAQLGDVIVADIVSKDGDRVLGNMADTEITVDERLAFKDGVADNFASQVVGARAGDLRTIDVSLSDAAADPNLRGKNVKAYLTIKEVKSVKMPELTHDLLHTFGVHSADQLRELLRVILKRRVEYMQRQAARRQVMEHFAATSKLDLPEEMIKKQARGSLQRRAMEMQANGMSQEEINRRLRMMQQDVLQATALALREQFVLQKIAEIEKIDVADDELEDEIERIAEQNNESARRIRARLEREDLLETLRADLIERKALDLVLDSAEYEDESLADLHGEGAVATVEEQAVPGEMQDPTAPPPEEPKAEAAPAAEQPPQS